ncbi:MAG: hypothetical protein JOZ62_11980 [Acidobacteriaceae bacterium]|nr:hypothetical protein [Acidobacteriaceae bacterium]
MRLLLSAVLLFTGAMSSFASVDQSLLSLAPPDAKLLTGIDITRVEASPFGQYLLRRVDTEDEHFREFTQATGFDPRRDLEFLLFAGFPPPEGRFAVLARGNFDAVRIQNAAIAHGMSVESINGVDVLANKKGHPINIAFLDGGIAAMADPATMHQILAQRSNPAALDSQLSDRVNKAGTDNDLWFVSALPLRPIVNGTAAPVPDSLAKSPVLQSIVESSGAIQFGDTSKFSFQAVTRSPQDAVALGDVARFGVNLVQTQAGNDPRAAIAAAALQSMQIETSGPEVRLSVSMTEKQLEQLSAPAPKRVR